MSKFTEPQVLRTAAVMWYISAAVLIVLAPIRGDTMTLLCGLMGHEWANEHWPEEDPTEGRLQ